MAANEETMYSVREKPWHGSGTAMSDKIESISETVMGSLAEETAEILLSLGDSFLKNKSVDPNISKNINREEGVIHEENGIDNRA